VTSKPSGRRIATGFAAGRSRPVTVLPRRAGRRCCAAAADTAGDRSTATAHRRTDRHQPGGGSAPGTQKGRRRPRSNDSARRCSRPSLRPVWATRWSIIADSTSTLSYRSRRDMLAAHSRRDELPTRAMASAMMHPCVVQTGAQARAWSSDARYRFERASTGLLRARRPNSPPGWCSICVGGESVAVDRRRRCAQPRRSIAFPLVE